MKIIFQLACFFILLTTLSACASTIHEDKTAPCSPTASTGKSPCVFIPVNIAVRSVPATTA